MRIYELQPKYDSRTGELAGRIFVEKEHRCDFTGVVFDDWLGSKKTPYARYSFHYGGMDGMFGCYGDESKLQSEYCIRAYELQDDEFEICEEAEEEFKQAFCESDCKSFDAFLRITRAATVLRLIEEEGMEPICFSGYEGQAPDDVIW